VDARYFQTQEEKKEDEQICAEQLSALSKDPSKQQKEKIIDLLSQFSPRRLYVLYQTSDIIQTCCAEKELEKKFNEQLVKNKFYSELPLPQKTFQSIDSKSDSKASFTITPFHQLMGYFLTVKSLELMETQPSVSARLLDKACEEGAYHALNERMERNLKILENSSEMTVNMVNPIVLQIYQDAQRMGNLYRSLGYYQAAFALLNALTDYFDIPGVKEDMEKYLASVAHTSRAKAEAPIQKTDTVELVELMLEKLMEYFYLSFFSSVSPSSIMLNEAINGGKDLMSGYQHHFSDWESGRKFFVKVLPEVFNVKSPAFFSRAEDAAKKVASESPSEYPGFTKKA
jgi:tetratricopeptide (TPR) repeat protein